MEDNIFDEDDALDYVLYEETEKKEKKQKQTNSGCLFLFLLIPIGGTYLFAYLL